jgi:hypothetical protein
MLSMAVIWRGCQVKVKVKQSVVQAGLNLAIRDSWLNLYVPLDNTSLSTISPD